MTPTPGLSRSGCAAQAEPYGTSLAAIPFFLHVAALWRRRSQRRIPMADHDRIEGSAKNMGGKIKEGAGKMTGDSKLQAEGKADQVEGKVQNAVGGVKDTVRDNRN
jgi:uncharacterized protein YjbJ (UPF0337 family)